VMDLFDMPGPYYDVTVGDAEIFVLDGNNVSDPKQLAWIERQLTRSKTAWQIAAFHQPPYSCSRHGSTTEVVDFWVPMFRKHGVDLVLSGHDHLYQRFEDDRGAAYVVTGGGGTFLDGVGECPDSLPPREAAVEYEHHFVAIRASKTVLRARAIGLEDASMDEFSLTPVP
jgi:3',5'-cyclic AMP phosphodiesterase CpdA